MPVYAVLADLDARFARTELVQLTDDAGTGDIDQDRIDQALTSASAMVEGFVASIYQLDPDAPVPVLLVDATCDIARQRLYRTSPPEDVTLRYNQAIKTLEGVRKGTIKLDGGSETLAPRPGQILTQGGVRRMSREQTDAY